VTFTGRVPHKQVQRYLSLFDIAPFPRQPLAVCELISPIKPFESMAMAKAVVVSSVAALTEIVQDGKTGLVFTKGEPADLARALERLLDSRALRESLGRAAREWVIAERDWAKIVRTVDETYLQILDGPPGRYGHVLTGRPIDRR
jgi:glycosyltransferase involved in cell wall biosynthesis